MRDVFYTLMVVWIVWRILNSVNSQRSKSSSQPSSTTSSKKEGETTVNFVPPKKKNVGDVTDGEYVEFEDIK